VEKSTYPNPAVVAASKNMVCVVGHAGHKGWETNHGSRDVKRGADKVKMCRHYTDIVCIDHVETFKQLTPKLFGNKAFDMPHHIFYSPAGEELRRSSGVVEAKQLAQEFAEALAKVTGNFVAKDEYEAAKTQVAGGLALVKKDEIKKAIDVFTKLTKHKNERLAAMGMKELHALDAGGSARVDAAIQALQSSEEEGKKELKKVADEYQPLACAKKAQEVLKLMAEKGR
jgi:hypothetical protein